MTTICARHDQIYSLETGNGHCRRPSERPVRTATRNDNRLDGRLNGPSWRPSVCRELYTTDRVDYSSTSESDPGTNRTARIRTFVKLKIPCISGCQRRRQQWLAPMATVAVGRSSVSATLRAAILRRRRPTICFDRRTTLDRHLVPIRKRRT